MKTITKKSATVLNALTDGLGFPEGSSRKIDNSAFMAVHVERIGEQMYSVAHYYKQNGDLVPDPDMVFFKGQRGEWIPMTFQDATRYTVAAEIREGGSMACNIKAVQGLSSFANIWMKNIKSQQEL